MKKVIVEFIVPDEYVGELEYNIDAAASNESYQWNAEYTIKVEEAE
jgi:hypothetical protein